MPLRAIARLPPRPADVAELELAPVRHVNAATMSSTV